MSSSTPRPPEPSRKPIQNFRIRWDQATQVFNAIKRTWTKEERSPDDAARPLMLWPQADYDDTNRTLGRKFSDLFFSKLDIGSDHEWHYDHALGKGGYGAVALFNKVNADTATIQDQVVIKTAKVINRQAVDEDRPELSREAAVMGQTNDLEEDGTLFLRQFKYYHGDDKQWRYYLEYCPYGDLEALRVRYKGYGRYLPELFLWHLFAWLATTIHEYNLYPTPRIADFGLAEVQSPRNKSNTAPSLFKGTPGWQPPEIRWKRIHPRNDFNPFGIILDPNVDNPLRKGRYRITSKANIWAIGAVMFSMTTLHESDVLSDMVDHILDQHLPVPPKGESVIDYDDFKIIRPQYYSMELRDLIKDCVRLHWDDRPSENEVAHRALDGYGKHLQVLRNLGHGRALQNGVDTHPDYKVYYRENEIHRAPDNYQFDHPDRTRKWYEDHIVRQFPWLPPSWGSLWPRTMPLDVAAPRHWSKGMQDGFLKRKQAQIGSSSITHTTASTAPRDDTEMQLKDIKDLDIHDRLSIGGSQQELQVPSTPNVPSQNSGDLDEMNFETAQRQQTLVPRTMVEAPTPQAAFEDNDEDDEDEGDIEQFKPGPVRANRLWTDRYEPYPSDARSRRRW